MLSELDRLRQALISISDNVYHYTGFGATPPYIVWAEDNEPSSVQGDNKKVNQTIEGTIDLYTKTEDDPLIEDIQGVLCDYEISFRLNSVYYEDETELIHFEWVFQVGC